MELKIKCSNQIPSPLSFCEIVKPTHNLVDIKYDILRQKPLFRQTDNYLKKTAREYFNKILFLNSFLCLSSITVTALSVGVMH